MRDEPQDLQDRRSGRNLTERGLGELRGLGRGDWPNSRTSRSDKQSSELMGERARREGVIESGECGGENRIASQLISASSPSWGRSREISRLEIVDGDAWCVSGEKKKKCYGQKISKDVMRGSTYEVSGSFGPSWSHREEDKIPLLSGG